MLIIDFYCYLNLKEIYENKRFKNIIEFWFGGDYYKWRFMRVNGIEEKYIIGSVDDYEKFLVWVKIILMVIGNLIYYWIYLEFKRYFGIDDILNEKFVFIIWEKINKVFKEFGVKNIILKFNVEVICIIDDFVDIFEYYLKLKDDKDFNVKVYFIFRFDKGVNIEREIFILWVKKFVEVCGKKIESYDEFLDVLKLRVEFFYFVGCCVFDYVIDDMVFVDVFFDEVVNIFKKVLVGEKFIEIEVVKYKMYILRFLGKVYLSFGWVM